jgi:7-cyano-7-deazaguanine synthase
MGFVNLISGGLDSTLISVMAKEDGINNFPLFIDYGQRAARKEWETCQKIHKNLQLPLPIKMDLSGFGQIIKSGLTNEQMDIKKDAFTPGRNFIFLLMGGIYAYQMGVSSVAIGLLTEKYSLFPDQCSTFITQAESAISTALGYSIKVLTPLMELGKADIVKLANSKGIKGTYSCHTGNEVPCGQCISCLEFQFNKEK